MLNPGQTEKVTSQLTRIVLERLEAGSLVVPSPPEIATRCLQLLRTSDFQAKKLVTQIETDPVLAALVLREASKASQGNAVKSIEPAVARLGVEKLKTLIVAYAAHELFESNDPRINLANKKIWEHSVACALLARDLAAFAGSSDGDTCYLGGLLHDIGKPVFAAFMLAAEHQLGSARAGWMDHAAWGGAISSVHRQIGTAVATRWMLPAEVTAAIRDCSDYDAAERGCPANVVRLANALAKREGYATDAVAKDDVDAMIMVGRSMLGVDEDVIARLASGLSARVTQATSGS